jgi:thiamine biosynthesis protein ThiC
MSRGIHDETFLDEHYKEAAFSLMCQPTFCSMKWSSKMDEFK